jgi:hypothetical protein
MSTAYAVRVSVESEPVDLVEFLNRYTNDVYTKRNPSAAANFISDPCLRHEHGHLVTMSLSDNIDRIAAFLKLGEISIVNRLVARDSEHVVSCFDIAINGDVVSGIEVFRVVNGKITETWNSSVQPGAWG